jgi:DNA-binding transcriptional ArsR family regulator
MVSPGAFDRALAGDVAARIELRGTLGLNPQGRDSINRLLTTPPDAVQTEIVSIVKAWASRVLPQFATDALVIIGRDVAAKEELVKTLPGRSVLEIATNGVDVDPAAWATDIVVVPTVAMRPFIAPVESGSMAIYLCSVADEAYDDDPAAPPRGLVKITTAIGDELRLRILRLLTNEELTASEVATRLGIERTSLHHHLGILRSAGLVAIRDDGFHHWRYSRRGARVSDVGSVLATYLDPPAS